tara:strand:+ start:771 stop:1967 length:1197 start_codon:yes stop_codon:yes gene_type:complete
MTKNFCAAPWRGLHIQVDGGISTCCAGGFKLGNINTGTIESALASDKLKKVRESMKQGKLPEDYCGYCINAKGNGLNSEQDWHNSHNEDFEIDNATDEYQYPVIFDARWNNTCNSVCIYCSPYFSSKWASTLNSHEQKPNQDNKSKIKTFFLDKSDRLKTVAMVGGEPLLMKENSDLLDSIPPHVKIDIISNLSSDVTKSKVFEKLLQKQKVKWHISLENIGERYEYVRQGSKWQTLVDNLKILGKEVRNPPEKNDHEIQFMGLFHLLNATHLCEFKDFAKEALSFFPHKFDVKNPHRENVEIVWQNYSQPVELLPENYGADVSKKIVSEIRKYLSTDSTPMEQAYFQSKIEIFSKLSTDTDDKTKKKFSVFINKNEKLFKNTNKFNKLWPELSFLTD